MPKSRMSGCRRSVVAAVIARSRVGVGRRGSGPWSWVGRAIMRKMRPSQQDGRRSMTDRPAKPVLLTGASGNLGRALTKWLAAEGWALQLTDIVAFPDPV